MNPNRLLVVDDEPDACEFVEAVAVDQRFDVVTCFHGEDFKREYGEFEPSLSSWISSCPILTVSN